MWRKRGTITVAGGSLVRKDATDTKGSNISPSKYTVFYLFCFESKNNGNAISLRTRRKENLMVTHTDLIVLLQFSKTTKPTLAWGEIAFLSVLPVLTYSCFCFATCTPTQPPPPLPPLLPPLLPSLLLEDSFRMPKTVAKQLNIHPAEISQIIVLSKFRISERKNEKTPM